MPPNYVIPLAFPYTPSDVGGLKSAMEAGIPKGSDITLIAPDSPESQMGNLTIKNATPLPAGDPERWDYWFGTGSCQVAFPEAFSDLATTPEALHVMYEEFPNNGHSKFSLNWLANHIDQNANLLADTAFAQRFSRPIGELVSNAFEQSQLVLAYQSFFFTPVIANNADLLRQHNIPSTWHWHESIPENLGQTTIGKAMLRAMSAVDIVFVHTDLFAKRLRQQFSENFPDSPMPCIQRFDLGTDEASIRKSLREYSKYDPSNIPGYTSLDSQQRHTIEEIYRSKKNQDIHSFICIDRIDPVKGNDVTIKAIRKFLEGTTETVEVLKDKYRFYFINNTFKRDENQDITYHASLRYSEYCERLLNDLIKDFPGIVFRCGALMDPTRAILPCLLQGSTLFTGGTVEGLSLATAEASIANEPHTEIKPASIITGSGTGMAIRLQECSLSDNLQLALPGSVDEFVACFTRVTLLRRKAPDTLRHSLDKLSAFMSGRKDRLVHNPDEIAALKIRNG